MVRKPLTLKINAWIASAILMALLLGPIGCSATSSPNYASLGLVNVSGTLKLDGVPLPNAEIRFEDPETLAYSYGITNESGRFSLMFDSRTAGIIPGRKLVRIFPKQKPESELDSGPSEAEDPDASGPAGASGGGSKVPDCYSSNSKYYVKISGATSSLEIDLKSDCSSVSDGN
jgi:hypothetical protein